MISTTLSKNDDHTAEVKAPAELSKVINEGAVIKVDNLERFGGPPGSKVFVFPDNVSISALVKAKAISQEE